MNDLEVVRIGVKLAHLVDRHKEWSDKTFGTPEVRGPVGPLKHLKKEVDECLNNPTDLVEYADCLLLIVDAARRQGASAENLIDLAIAKMEVNEKRVWNVGKSTEPTEHIRELSPTL